MKPANFAYHRPGTCTEAADLLYRLRDDVKVIAGGQSLLPLMNMRLAEPAHLVDVSAVPELRRTDLTAEGATYGAATTHMMFEHQLVPDVADGLLSHAARGIGYRAIRNRGTVGGSLAHSDSSAEWPTVMSALGATVHALSVRGERRIPVTEFLLGFFSTALADDELITAVSVPRIAPGTQWGMYKMARKPGEFADSLAVVQVRDTGASTPAVSVWLGAAKDVPLRLKHVEKALADRPDRSLLPADLSGPLAADIGADTATASPHDRHALQLHAVTVHRALMAVGKAPHAA
ncbi:FAD binding domain-containing protein [Streptomyces pinistramenti]|uniref:FAD binding domain-containing protein n=1 Tax=Streptomyces pinistramenti TaxID=2884812 RepID=UPI001D079D6E|nr:FAD binding domain-containing protein [Streptomyces pinistramenti]MCB5906129.1 FAD binding domain-containing protein [Streptomyces pinistramenti]